MDYFLSNYNVFYLIRLDARGQRPRLYDWINYFRELPSPWGASGAGAQTLDLQTLNPDELGPKCKEPLFETTLKRRDDTRYHQNAHTA